MSGLIYLQLCSLQFLILMLFDFFFVKDSKRKKKHEKTDYMLLADLVRAGNNYGNPVPDTVQTRPEWIQSDRQIQEGSTWRF